MSKIFFATMLAFGLIIGQAAQVQAEMVNVPETEYYIFTETLKYDSQPTHEGKLIRNAYNFSIEGTRNINFKNLNGEYFRFIYIFKHFSDKKWHFRTNDEKMMPHAVYADANSSYRVIGFNVMHEMLLKAIEYLPEADAAQLKADLVEQSDDTTSSGSSSIGSLPDASKLAELKQAAEPFVTQADEKFKAKDYTAAKELFSQAIEKNPYDYHSHDLYARSLYREKTKEKDYDLILAEAKKALELAPDNTGKADCCGFIAKVYRKLAMNNLFDTNKNREYLNLGQEYLDMENKFRLQQ